MKRPPDKTPELPGFALHFPASVVPTGRADGAVLVIPGRPVLTETEVTTAEAVALLGGRYARRTVQKLARALGAHSRGPGCKLVIPVAALATLKRRRAE